MNNGKLCISVAAETADEMIAKINQARPLADIIELRFDSLDPGEFSYEEYHSAGKVHKQILDAAGETPIITTFRPADRGGRRELSDLERGNFWGAGCETEYGDFEIDQLDDSQYWLWGTRICSFHDFEGVPKNVVEIFDMLQGAVDGLADVIKIAVAADDATDAIPIWHLLERAKAENKKMIPIAMGEAGKWTRILGLAHGAFLTYASLDAGGETAGGQITAKDLIDVYRVKEHGPETKVYAIIGDPVAQSFSPYLQNAAFAARGADAVFIPMLVRDIDSFMRRMVLPATREVELNFGGFSVTMPHKQSIMKHLDVIDPVAKKIGAVNTVKIDDNGRLTGYNTDADGFITPLVESYGSVDGARVAVFGAGGAARACVYALKQAGADVTVFARDGRKATVFGEEFDVAADEIHNAVPGRFDVVVDATPFGMKGPLEKLSLFTSDELKGVKFVYDLVTKAFDTPLITEAKKAGIPALGGIEMVITQGAMQFKIWTGEDAPFANMHESVMARLRGQNK